MSYLLIVLAIFAVGFIVFSLRFAWWRESIDLKFPRVLMYHMIAHHLPKNASKFNRLRVPPREFEKQLAWLKKEGFKSFFMSEISPNLPEKSIIITFDDGYKDNLANALPLLKKYGFKATIFIVVNRLNNDWAHDRDSGEISDELNNEVMLSNDDVRELLKSGLIEIGSHTLDHANLAKISDDEKQRQIALSKEKIEVNFGIKCESLTYPFGFYDEKSLKIAEQYYKFAATTHNDVLRPSYTNNEIPRIMISGRQGLLSFILKINKGRAR